MLVLTRGPGEEIVITTGEGPITVKVVKISPTRVKLGIEAPEGMLVLRGELHNHLAELMGRKPD